MVHQGYRTTLSGLAHVDQSVTPRRRAPAATDRPAVASSSRARNAAGVSRSASSAARTAARPADPPPSSRCAAPQCQARRRRRHVLVGAPVPVLPVVVREQGEAHGRRVPLLAQVADEDQVAERLRHLRPAQPDQADVEPQPDEALARHRLGLRRLALVMGEHQIAAAAVDVDRLTQLTQREGGALNVPTRAGPGPNATPRPARRAATAATTRSRAGPACWGPPGGRRARPPAPACAPGRSR